MAQVILHIILADALVSFLIKRNGGAAPAGGGLGITRRYFCAATQRQAGDGRR